MLKVIKPGIYSTIQDLGRYGYATSGVPVSGAMDHYSAKVANLLLQNDKNDAVLEVTFNGEFQFLKETIFSIAGANLNAVLDNESVQCNQPIKTLFVLALIG